MNIAQQKILDAEDKVRNLINFLHEIHSTLSIQGDQKMLIDEIESVLDENRGKQTVDMSENTVSMPEPETMNGIQALAMIEKDRSLEMFYADEKVNTHNLSFTFNEFVGRDSWRLQKLYDNQYIVRKRVTNLDKAVAEMNHLIVDVNHSAANIEKALSKYIRD